MIKLDHYSFENVSYAHELLPPEHALVRGHSLFSLSKDLTSIFLLSYYSVSKF